MKKAGQIVLFKFPQGDLEMGKLRPALLLKELPGAYHVWLICMISSNLQQKINGFDEILAESDNDFKKTGLKTSSLIRLGRLAVVDDNILLGSIGKINSRRLLRLNKRLADWLIDKAKES